MNRISNSVFLLCIGLTVTSQARAASRGDPDEKAGMEAHHEGGGVESTLKLPADSARSADEHEVIAIQLPADADSCHVERVEQSAKTSSTSESKSNVKDTSK